MQSRVIVKKIYHVRICIILHVASKKNRTKTTLIGAPYEVSN